MGKKIVLLLSVLYLLISCITQNDIQKKVDVGFVVDYKMEEEKHLTGLKIWAKFQKQLPEKHFLVIKFSDMKYGYKRHEVIKLDNNRLSFFDHIETKGEENNFDHKVILEPISFDFKLFDNLDIFVEYGDDRMAIQGFDIEVIVRIPLSNFNSKYEEHLFLIVFDDKIEGDVRNWFPISDSKSGIISYTKTQDYIEFVISEWPDDDRMIAYGP